MDNPDSLRRELETARQRIAELEAAQQRYDETARLAQEALDGYQNLFEYAADSIFIVDPLTLNIINANTGAARRLGYTLEELLQINLSNLEVAPETPDPNTTWISNASGTQVYECQYRRKDGGLTPVEVSSRMVRLGKRMVIQNFVREISRRKQMEIERERLISELDAFAHTVAHDLKAPLSMIIGYTSLLSDYIDDMPLEQIKAQAKVVEQTSFKMTRIIEELLLLASVRNQADVIIMPLSMKEIVEDVLARLSLLLETNHVELHLPDTWPTAVGYAAWVEEIWVNYISNAVKYGGEPPVITLGAQEEPGGKVRFWVRDNGQGIPADKLSNLFTEFTRVGQKRVEGHGLGLSIVQRIVQRLGGQVGVESTLDQGSTFSFTLPANVT